VLYASLREILSGFSTEEGQYLSPGTDKVYKRVAKSKKWKEHSVDLDYGARGHWLGHHDAQFVMIYCHGACFYSLDMEDLSVGKIQKTDQSLQVVVISHLPRQGT
jgi:hypothetical protein